MQKELKSKINNYLKNRRKKRNRYQVLTVISMVVILVVYSVLTKPAISMAYDNISVEAMRENTAFGDVVPVRVTAEALEGTEPTTFVIYTKGVGGGLSSEYQFRDGVCQITAEDGSIISLHKGEIMDEENGTIVKKQYWFQLSPEEKTAFVLHYTSDVEAITITNDISHSKEETSEADDITEAEATTEKVEEATTEAEATTEKAEETTTEAEATTEKAEETTTEAEATTEKAEETTTEAEATTEKVEEITTEVEATTEKVEETTTEAETTTEKVEEINNSNIEKQSIEQLEEIDVSFVDPTTFNKNAFAEVEYTVADNEGSTSTETTEVTTGEGTTEEVIEATEDGSTISENEDIGIEETTKTDQYLEIYVAASADGGYEQIASELAEQVENWQGNVPVEQITNHKVASLYWTDNSYITDVILKARTEKGTLVTISGDRSNFNNTALQDLMIKVEENSSVNAETMESIIEDKSFDILQQRGFQITFLANGQEVQPAGEFNLLLDDFEYQESTTAVEVYQVAEEGTLQKIDSSFSEDGTLSIMTNGSDSKNYEIVFLGDATKKVSKNALTAIHITKEWEDGKEPEDISELGVYIYDDTGEEVATATLTKESGWKTTIKDLPLYNEDGELIQYSMVEDVIEGYTVGDIEYSGQEKVWIPVEEELEDGSEYLTLIEEDGKQYIYSSKDPSNKVEVTEGQLGEEVVKEINDIETDCLVIEEITIAEQLGLEIHSSVDAQGEVETTNSNLDEIEEATSDEQELTISTYNTLSLKSSLIGNDQNNVSTSSQLVGTYQEGYTDINLLSFSGFNNGNATVKVKKEWKGGQEDSVTVQLKCKEKNSSVYSSYGKRITLNKDNDWNYTWNDLSSKYEYTVEEVAVPNGYTASTNEKTTTNNNKITTTVTITNTKSNSGLDDTGNIFPHTKTIDYLGDGEDDSSLYTSLAGNDMYRLYLDLKSNALPTPVDVIFVIDNSGSMDDPWTSGFNNISKAKKVYNEAFALAKQIIDNSAENRVSVISYANTAQTHGSIGMNNMNYIQFALQSATRNPDGGTNMMAGLMETLDVLEELEETASDDRKTYVFFLSDGVPTYYYEHNHLEGNGGDGENNVTEVLEETESYIQNTFKPALSSDVTVYTLGVGLDTYNNGGKPGGNQGGTNYRKEAAEEILGQYIPTDSSLFLQATSDGTLAAVFDTLWQGLEAKGITITDTLSEYVDLAGQVDLLVTMQERLDKGNNCGATKREAERVLWAGKLVNGELEQNTDYPDNGLEVGNQVTAHMKTYHDDKNEVSTTIIQSASYDSDTKQITVTFNPDYIINGDYVYTLSFNVQVNEIAKAKYKELNQSYPTNMIGDARTDYGNNTTSSNQAGFFANAYTEEDSSYTQTGVSVSYTVIKEDGEEEKIEAYKEKPVVQVEAEKDYQIALKKVDVTDSRILLSGVEFDLYRVDDSSSDNIPETEGVKGIKVNQSSLVTNASGNIMIDKTSLVDDEYLIDDTYYLVETKAASGYQKLTKAYSFSLSNGTLVINGTDSMLNAGEKIEGNNIIILNLIVKNSKTASLPETGGMGTTSFTLIGITTMTVAVIGSIYMKKRQNDGGER